MTTTTYPAYSVDSISNSASGSNLRDLPYPPTTQDPILALGYYTSGDGGGGLFYWDGSSNAADDGGAVINPTGNIHMGNGRWLRVFDGPVYDVRWWGTKGDGILDDAQKIQNAITYLTTNSGGNLSNLGGILYCPGTYFLTSTVNVFGSGVNIWGAGKGSRGSTTGTIFNVNHGDDAFVFGDVATSTGAANCSVKDIRFVNVFTSTYTGSTINGAHEPNGLIIENVEIAGAYQAITIANCNGLVLRRLNLGNVADGGYGVRISDEGGQSYNIFIEDVIVSAATGTSVSANGFVFDGKVTTMAIIRTAFLNGNIAYWFTGSSEAAPQNIFGFRMGCDFSNQGFNIEYGQNFEIFDCHVHCDPPPPPPTTNLPGFYFGPNATQFGAWGGQVKGAGGNGLEIAGTYFVWRGIQELDQNSKNNSDPDTGIGLYDGILIDATAANVDIQGNLGVTTGSNTQRYGVTIQPGATNIRVEGYLDDNQAGPFLNQSVDENIDIVNLSSLPRDRINRAVNGGFEIWQRGTTFTIPVSTTMPVADRFHATTSAFNASTVSRAIPGLSNGSKYCLRFQRNGTQTGTGFLVLEQAYDAADIVPFHGERVSARVMVRGGANYSGGALTLIVYCGTGTPRVRGTTAYTGETPLPLNSSVTPSASIQMVSAASADVVPTNTTQMCIQAYWTPSGTAGASDYVDFDDFALCVGSSLALSPHQPFSSDLDACVPYFRKSFPYATAPKQNAGSTNGAELVIALGATSGIPFGKSVRLSPPMVAVPVLTTYNPVANNSKWRDATSGADFAATIAGQDTSGFEVTGTSTSTTTDKFYVHWTADAEVT